MVGLTPPPHEWVGNDGKPIYFDSIDNSAYILGQSPHGDPNAPWVHIAWKYLYTAKDSLARIGSKPGRNRCDLQSHHGSV